MKFFTILFLLSSNVLLFGQSISGIVFETNSKIPVAYVNIGIVGKDIGTVSDQNGKYTLQINPKYYNDTLKFSCIGYRTYSVKVSDFVKMNETNVKLEKRVYNMPEVVVRPKTLKQKTLGITTKNKAIAGCFMDSIHGYEVGVLMKNKNRAFLKEVNLNIIYCTYDTIFYRINIYKALGNMQFENILTNPIYIKSSKQELKKKVIINLRPYNISVEGNFLVTFEAVKNLGVGNLCYAVNLSHKTYVRGASQGTWFTRPVGISISTLVDVEK
jgi:hypothetical protein